MSHGFMTLTNLIKRLRYLYLRKAHTTIYIYKKESELRETNNYKRRDRFRIRNWKRTWGPV